MSLKSNGHGSRIHASSKAQTGNTWNMWKYFITNTQSILIIVTKLALLETASVLELPAAIGTTIPSDVQQGRFHNPYCSPWQLIISHCILNSDQMSMLSAGRKRIARPRRIHGYLVAHICP